jgi:hypothetical protein
LPPPDTDDEKDAGSGATTDTPAPRGATWYYGSRATNPKKEKDGLGNQSSPTRLVQITSDGDIDSPAVGDVASVDSEIVCAGGITNWYRQSPAGTPVPLDPNDNGGILIFQNSNTYTFVIDDIDYAVWAEVSCPDPTSPTGYSDPIRSEPTPIIQPGFIPGLEDVNFSGSYSPSGTTAISYSLTAFGESKDINGVCVANAPAVSSGTINVPKLEAIIFVGDLGAGECVGTNRARLQVVYDGGQKGDIANVSGGGGWTGFSGSMSFSTTAGDAIPADGLRYQ